MKKNRKVKKILTNNIKLELFSQIFPGVIVDIAISKIYYGACSNGLSKLIKSEHFYDISEIGNVSAEPLMFEDMSRVSFYDPPNYSFRGEIHFDFTKFTRLLFSHLVVCKRTISRGIQL